MALPNPALPLDVDFLYHLGLDTNMDLKKLFGHVKAVVIGGSSDRMSKLAASWAGRRATPHMLVGKTERYSLYLCDTVIFVNHNMGMPTTAILLHEVVKLMMYAGFFPVPIIRVGTSGGVGVEPGTIVVTSSALDGMLEESYTLAILGKHVTRPSIFDKTLVEQIAEGKRDDLNVVVGKTMSTDCFYEGQGRLDGAICEYTEADKMEFLKKAHEKGVVNIEMESAMMAAFLGKVKCPGTSVCVALLNRLDGDQVSDATAKAIPGWTEKAIELVFRYLEKHVVASA